MKFRTTLTIFTFLLLQVGGRANALTYEEFEGHWNADLRSEAFPEGSSGSFDFWLEDDEPQGIVGTAYGTFRIAAFSLAENTLNVQFLTPIGIGDLSLLSVDESTAELEWRIGTLFGSGTATLTDPESVSGLDLERLSGVFAGVASGPLLAGEFPISMELTSHEGEVGGTVQTPIGKFDIRRTLIHHHRFIFEIANSEDVEGLIVGSQAQDDSLEIFWGITFAVGVAFLKKSPETELDTLEESGSGDKHNIEPAQSD